MSASVTEGIVMSNGAVKTSAPVVVGAGVSSMEFFGVPLPDLVPLLTCIYMVVMILHLGWKWYQEWKDSKKDE